MDPRISVLVGLMGVFAVGSAGAAEVVCDPVVPPNLVIAGTNTTTGHYFEVYADNGISWADAKSSVSRSGRKCGGVTGHLATITSEGEDSFVEDLRSHASLSQPEVWVGGLQPSNEQTRGAGWYWDNGEGPISTPQIPLPSYSNWLKKLPVDASEPNDYYGPGTENQMAIGHNNLFGWNDEGAAGNIGGYIVEYDVPRPAACVGTSCETIEGQVLAIPKEWIDSTGDTIKFSSYEFTDPRAAKGTCGSESLKLFEYLGPAATLHIPPYLCGSPKFVVVAVDGKDLNFTKGTVLIENDTAKVLGVTPSSSYPYACKDTKGPILPTAGEDPQGQDVVVYQTTDPARMLEHLTQDPQFVGAAGEFTDSCGSSRGSGKETSYFVVGMHVDFGAMGSTPAGSKDSFVRLTRYKLTLLQQSVVAARSAGALRPGVSAVMDALVRLAIYSLDRGNAAGALVFVKQFLRLVDAVNYTPVPDNNYNGEHLMRGRNIEFTLRVKVIPPIGP